ELQQQLEKARAKVAALTAKNPPKTKKASDLYEVCTVGGVDDLDEGEGLGGNAYDKVEEDDEGHIVVKESQTKNEERKEAIRSEASSFSSSYEAMEEDAGGQLKVVEGKKTVTVKQEREKNAKAEEELGGGGSSYDTMEEDESGKPKVIAVAKSQNNTTMTA